MNPFRWLLLLSLLFLALRGYAATYVGFGDAEALYVTYGLHPQLVYLDHPGMVGWVARFLGGKSVVSPIQLHFVTAIVATAIPWMAVLASRWLGASREVAPLAGLALIAAPEITVGLFALTPDLLLAPLWILAAGAWGRALLQWEARGSGAPWALLGGALAGLAAASKVSGFLLLLAMLISILIDRKKPWIQVNKLLVLGGFLGLIVASPTIVGEVQSGFSMLTHRLVSTQQHAGFSLRNVAALVGGQIGYLSPFVFVIACGVVRALIHSRSSPRERWLLLLAAVSGVPLALLCLWSRVAEPHWLAPAWISVALALPFLDLTIVFRWGKWALGSGIALSLLVHLWTLTDLAPRWLGHAYEGRFDLANDLLLWKKLGSRVVAMRSEVQRSVGVDPVIVAPHWIVAAQAAAFLGEGAQVSTIACIEGGQEVPDDFCRWKPPSSWGAAPILWVSDDRFALEPPNVWTGREESLRERVELYRGGRAVRGARLVLLQATGKVQKQETGSMKRLEGGRFLMGSNDGFVAERPVHPVEVTTFWMDETEVTVDAYAHCVQAGICSEPRAGEDCTWKNRERGQHPINCVDWEQSSTFCEWAGKRLPTEEEWEYAARGQEGRRYPWGNTEPETQLCWRQNSRTTCRIGMFHTGNTSTGLKDMAGNVWEWTASHFCPYTLSGYDREGCGEDRVIRGGGWKDLDIASRMSSTQRLRTPPSSRSDMIGFRCARSD